MLALGFELEEMVKFIENFDLDKLIIVNTENLFTTFNVCENTKIEKTYSTHKASFHTYWANHFLLLKISMDRPDMAIAL